MKQKTLLMTKAFFALVAMLFSFNAFAAKPERPFDYKLASGQYLDGWTKVIKVLVNDQVNGDLDTYTVDPSLIYVTNAKGITQYVSNATFDADADGNVDTEGTYAVLTVDLGSTMRGIFGGFETTYYQVNFPVGSIESGAAKNTDFAQNIQLKADPKFDWTAAPVPGILFEGDKWFQFTVSAALQSAYTGSQIPTDDLTEVGATEDLLKNANKVNGSSIINSATVIANTGSEITIEVELVDGATGSAVPINIPKELLSIGDATSKNPLKKISVPVTKTDAITMVEAACNPSYMMKPEKIKEYYVQFLLNGKADQKFEYENYTMYVFGAYNTYYDNADFTVTDVQAEKGNGVFKLTFNPELELNSDYVIALDKKHVLTADHKYANGQLLELEMIIKVDANFVFNDTKVDDVPVITDKIADIKTPGLWNIEFNKLTYNRWFDNANFKPLAVPFDIEASEVAEAFDIFRLTSVVEEEGALAFKWTKLAETETAYHNMPYLIKGKAAGNAEVVLENRAMYAPGTDKVLDILYTKADANAEYASLWGGYEEGDLKTVGTFTQEEADEWNLSIPGAINWKNESYKNTVFPVNHPYVADAADQAAYQAESAVVDRAGAKFTNVEDVKLFNSYIAGAKAAGDLNPDNDEYYTEDEAYEWNINNVYVPGVEEGGVMILGNSKSAKIQSQTTHERFKFYNTSEENVIGGEYYIINTKGNLVKRNNSAKTLGAWRWFMTVEDKGINYVKIFVDDELIEGEEATAIKEVLFNQDSENIFMLNGAKVAAPAKGINIINGKKVLVK